MFCGKFGHKSPECPESPWPKDPQQDLDALMACSSNGNPSKGRFGENLIAMTGVPYTAPDVEENKACPEEADSSSFIKDTASSSSCWDRKLEKRLKERPTTNRHGQQECVVA